MEVLQNRPRGARRMKELRDRLTELTNYTSDRIAEIAAALSASFHIIPRDGSEFSPRKLPKSWDFKPGHTFPIYENGEYSIERNINQEWCLWLQDYHVCTLPRTQSEAEAVLRLISGGKL